MVRPYSADAESELMSEPGEVSEVKAYLQALTANLRGRALVEAEGIDSGDVPKRVFEVLTSREFCYLSKGRAAAYRDGILAQVTATAARGRPIDFYYDIGGGYHASTRPGEDAVSFEVGLAEVCVLSQIGSFAGQVARFYPPGVVVSLVIDNMCAFLINDIPLVKTLEYCARLRELIRRVGMENVVDLLVESEHVTVSDFEGLRKSVTRDEACRTVSRKEHDNVERFLGRRCDEEEAVDRTSKYEEVIGASERLLARFIRGVHMTQRAGEKTICFRAFPGGDSRIQCGQIALTRNSKQKLQPILLTSGNRNEYLCRRFDLVDWVIPYVTYAARIQV